MDKVGAGGGGPDAAKSQPPQPPAVEDGGEHQEFVQTSPISLTKADRPDAVESNKNTPPPTTPRVIVATPATVPTSKDGPLPTAVPSVSLRAVKDDPPLPMTTGAAATAVISTTPHIRVPTIPMQAPRPAPLPPRLPSATSLPRTLSRAVVSGQLVAPSAMTKTATLPVVSQPQTMTQTSTIPKILPFDQSAAKNLPVSLAILPQPGAGTIDPPKVTVVHAPSGGGQTTLEIATSVTKPVQPPPQPATIKPISPGVTLTTGYPVTIRTPASLKPTASGLQQSSSAAAAVAAAAAAAAGNSPIQLVPISGGGAGPRAAAPGVVVSSNAAAAAAAARLPTAAVLKTTPLRAPLSVQDQQHPVRVTLVQSSATITKISQAPKPGALLTAPAARHTTAAAASLAPTSSIRIGLPPQQQQQQSRMTVVPSSSQPQVSVTLNTTHLNVPQPQQQLTRIYGTAVSAAAAASGSASGTASGGTGGGGARLFSVPSSSVSIQKAFVTSGASLTTQTQTKVSLPYGTSSISVPKPVGTGIAGTGSAGIITGTGGGIPVARVIPQLAQMQQQQNTIPPPPGTNLFLTRPATIHQQTSGDHPQPQVSLLMTQHPPPPPPPPPPQQQQQQQQPTDSARLLRTPTKQGGPPRILDSESRVQVSPRPGILRRRGEADRELIIERQSATAGLPESIRQQLLQQQQARNSTSNVPAGGATVSVSAGDTGAAGGANNDAASSSGSTTLSATSSPCDEQAGNLSGPEDLVIPKTTMTTTTTTTTSNSNNVVVGLSPRKKPRKQEHSQMREHSWSENDDDRFSSMGATIRRKQPHNHQQPPPQQQQPPPEPVIKTHPKPTLLQSYRHSWRSRHNHFLRHSDVRVREKRQPTVQELAADGGGAASLIQALGGWKIWHMASQMDEIMETETSLSSILSSLQRRLEKALSSSETVSTPLRRDMSEVIKANMQRTRVVQEQVCESRECCMHLFEHKTRVRDIVTRYVGKRQVKKREIR